MQAHRRTPRARFVALDVRARKVDPTLQGAVGSMADAAVERAGTIVFAARNGSEHEPPSASVVAVTPGRLLASIAAPASGLPSGPSTRPEMTIVAEATSVALPDWPAKAAEGVAMATAPAIIRCLRRSDIGSCFTVFSSRLAAPQSWTARPAIAIIRPDNCVREGLRWTAPSTKMPVPIKKRRRPGGPRGSPERGIPTLFRLLRITMSSEELI